MIPEEPRVYLVTNATVHEGSDGNDGNVQAAKPRSGEAVYASNPAHTHGTMRQARGVAYAVRSVIFDNVIFG